MYIQKLILIVCLFMFSKYETSFISWIISDFCSYLSCIIFHVTSYYIQYVKLNLLSTRCNNLLSYKCARRALLHIFKTTCANILEIRNSLLSLICKTLNCNPHPHFVVSGGSFKPVCSLIITNSLLYALFMLVCLIGSRLKPVIPVSPTAQVILLSFAYCKTSFPIYKPFYESSHLCTPTTPSIFIAFICDAHELFTVSSLTITNKNISLAASQLYKCINACHLSTAHDTQILEQLSELNNLLSSPHVLYIFNG